jgi:hypothetical protein
MWFPVLGMTTAVWLLSAPFVGLEVGLRAGLSVAMGCAALFLAPMAVWSPACQRWLGILGGILGFANFGMSGGVGAEASFAVSAIALLFAGMAPHPITTAAVTAKAIVPVT